MAEDVEAKAEQLRRQLSSMDINSDQNLPTIRYFFLLLLLLLLKKANLPFSSGKNQKGKRKEKKEKGEQLDGISINGKGIE